MDDFRKLIESSILTALQNANYLKTTPCTVTAVSDDVATVKLVDTDAEYTLPNWSGSGLVVGESAQIYYKGNIISESTAYIGASLNKDSGGGGVNYIINALNDLVTTSSPQTIDKSLDMLDELRDLLANVLTEKGIPSSETEKYNELVDKVSQIEIKQGNEPVSIKQLLTSGGSGVLANIEGKTTPFDYTQIWTDDATTSNSLSFSLPYADNGLIVVAAMFRGNTIEISGEGWTKVITTSPTSDLSQKTVVWTKPAVKGQKYSVTLTQDTSVRLTTKMIYIKNATAISLVADSGNLSSVPYTPPAKTDKERLYFVSNVYYWSGAEVSSMATWTDAEVETMDETRFSGYYEHGSGVGNVSFTFSGESSYNTDTMNVLTFDILKEV